MQELICTVRRVGNYDSRTEEYEVLYEAGEAPARTLRVKYQAARAYEINAALDAATEAARAVISAAGLEGPTDEAISKFTWRTIQSAKYREGEPESSRLGL